ncbi:MAG: haloacid dehalogenase-like hydrolase [Polyangiaceae bacterium]
MRPRARKKRVVLFDIDGTLIRTKGSGRRAFRRAFQELHGRDDACAFSFGGMTDKLIARTGLEAIGESVTDGKVAALIDRYLQLYAESQRLEPDISEVMGARTCVLSVRAFPHVHVGLGTGNVRRGAEIKLGAVSLWSHFDFGGFGCDAEPRHEVLRAGMLRGGALAGAEYDVVVVGDTVRDVDAALAIGATCVGVAEAPEVGDSLRAAGAAHVFANLEGDEVVRAIAF